MRCYTIVRAVLLLASVTSGLGASPTSHNVTSRHLFSSTPSTCASASINYITQALPQQCLASRWLNTSATTSHTENCSADPLPASVLSSSDSEAESNSLEEGHSSDLGTAVNTTRPEKIPATRSDTGYNAGEEYAAPIAIDLGSTTISHAEAETDSPLNDANFLSFEDWKKQSLDQAGLAADSMSQKLGQAGVGQDRRRPGSIALDTLGEEGEIELDFSGFGRPAGQDNRAGGNRDDTSATAESPPTATVRARSKDAGKTCKERFNYASFDCAANVLKTNPRCKSSSSILVENKDSYMLNECSLDNKFLIVELCDHIQIDTVVLANFEFFSSMFRTFRISVSDRYPVKIDRWKTLGTYEAKNSREIQAFLVENPLIWARYLRIEFLAHYGSEYYCPLSLVRVHGTTMMEEFRYQEELARGEIDNESEEEEVELASSTTEPQIASIPPVEVPVIAQSQDTISKVTSEISQGKSGPASDRKNITQCATPVDSKSSVSQVSETSGPVYSSVCPATSDIVLREQSCSRDDESVTVQFRPPATSSVNTTTLGDIRTIVSASRPTDTGTSATAQSKTTAHQGHKDPRSSNIIHSSNSTSNATAVNSTVVINTTASTGTPIAATPIPSQVAIAPAQPSSQESFFKSIHKRLQALESNATLSLQYIESQSQLLRSAFATVDKRQLNKTAIFLETLNITVLAELGRARADYETLWQSAVLELASQREEGRRERELIGEQVKLLAEQMVSQKRIMIVQASLLALCLGLVVFARVAMGSDSDSGIVQGMHGLVVKGMRRGLSRRRREQKDSGDRSVWQWDGAWSSPRSTRPGTSADGEFDSDGEPQHSDGHGVAYERDIRDLPLLEAIQHLRASKRQLDPAFVHATQSTPATPHRRMSPSGTTYFE